MRTELHQTSARRRITFITGGAAVVALATAAAGLLPLGESSGSAQPESAGENPAARYESVTQESEPEPAPEPEPVPAAEQTAEAPEDVEVPFDAGSCPPVARACVDLDGERAWLQQDGQVSYGAVPVGQGGPGYETPRGTFHVTRKVIDEVSWQFENTPMPYAVYFTNNGHAFHEGDPAGDSHGCVRLNHDAAVTYFDQLQVGDMVHIY